MSGFGSGSFGNENFGQAGWAKRVLFDLIPNLYKNQDELSGNYLRSFSEGLQPSFDLLRQKIENFTDLRDPLNVQTQYTNAKKIILGKIIIPKGNLKQRGIDGTVNSLGEFRANSARFSHDDIGRILYLSRSTIPANNKEVTIVSVINNKTVLTVPSLVTTSSVFRWELRDKVLVNANQKVIEIRKGDISDVYSDWDFFDNFSKTKIVNRNLFSVPNGTKAVLTEKEGTDGFIDSQGRFTSNTFKITAKDIGKFFTIFGSDQISNNGKFEIKDIDTVSPTDIRAVVSRIIFKGQDENGGIVYTVRNGQEQIRIKQIKEGINTSLSINVENDTDIIVTLATDVFGDISSTANDVVSAIEADATANELVSVIETGTGLGLAEEHDFSEKQNGILIPDSGPLIWALLPFPQLTINRVSTPLGVVEQEGIDASITLNAITSATAQFTSHDIGKCISIVGSSTITNNGLYEIISITNANTVVIDTTLTTDAGPLCWELRTFTNIGNGIEININAPAIIVRLGQDFALEVDEREVELRQRNFVNNFNQWFDKKGHEDSYEILGKVGGFDVNVFPLFRITRDLALSGLSGANVIEVGETGTGRLGTDGSILYNSDGSYIFNSDSAVFKNTDIGSCLRISDANTSSNNTLFTIISFIDANNVGLDLNEGMVVDLNNGSLTWSIVKLYFDQPPELPNYDEINSDLLTELVGTPSDYPEFTVDKFCWEPDIVDSISITIDTDPSNTKFLSTNRVQITFTGDAEVISSIGNWYIQDDDGNQFFLETLPEETAPASGIYTTEVISSILPTTGGILGYRCPVNMICFYCAASKIFLTIEANGILEDSGVSLEKMFDRLLKRFEDVKPVHVSLVPRYIQPLAVSFNIGVTIDPGLFKNDFIVPFTAYYDVIPADAVIEDIGIQVTIDTP